ncbi:PREDICTED: mas-related G-protein coupled receptor member B2-like, partial [Tauraco erythrolophus]|uniref:mas-related G-protein coupled receptor member B2-like n=1 Tax=Tauraco erythrolophus TaxID=121530 RepID=UPI00052365AE
MVKDGVCIGISLCGLVGNGIVMWFLGFHMKQNPFTIYILHLAEADFSLLLLFFLLLLADLSNCETVFDSVDTTISIILSSMMLISNLSLFVRLRCGSQRWHLEKLYVAVLLYVIFFFAL